MVLALGTANDWIGRTSDFVGGGVVLLVLALAVATYLAARSRLAPGAAVVAAGAVGLCALLAVELRGLQPSAVWVALAAAYAGFAAWDLRRTVRRAR
ncbi:hypothetical protein BH23ACT10_BH23ACT10_04120 [soil metagenome]